MKRFKDKLGRKIKFGDIIIGSDYTTSGLIFYKLMRSLTKREIEDGGYWQSPTSINLVVGCTISEGSCYTDVVDFECKIQNDNKEEIITLDAILVESPLIHVDIQEIALLIDYNNKKLIL